MTGEKRIIRVPGYSVPKEHQNECIDGARRKNILDFVSLL